MSRLFSPNNSDFINCGPCQNKMFDGNPFTMVIWQYDPGVNATQVWISKEPGAPDTCCQNDGTSRGPSIRLDYTGTVFVSQTDDSNSIPGNKWASIVCTWDGSNLANLSSLYVNLILINQSLSNSNGVGSLVNVGGNNFTIGGTGQQNRTFRGMLAFCQYFSTVLSFKEMAQAVYYPGSIRRNLVGFWPLFGESSPEPDYSGNGFHGTLNGTKKGFSDPPINGILNVTRRRLFPSYIAPQTTTITFDFASSSGYEPSLSTYSWNHTVINKNNRILVVGVGIFAVGSVTSVKFNGVDLTFLRADTGSIYRSELWYLIAPAVGTYQVTVTLNASLTSIANAQSYYSVDQSNPIDAHNGNNGTNSPASASVVSIVDKDMVIGNLVAQTASGIVSAGGQNSRTTNNGALGTDASDDKGIVTPPGSTTLSWTGMGALDAWAVSLVALTPIGGSSGTSPIIIPKRKLKTLLNVGL